MLWALAQAQAHDPHLSLQAACHELGVPRATVYRWLGRQRAGGLDDRIVVPKPAVVEATPEEIARVCQYAEAHAELGYKRLTWALVDENVAYLRPWMVYGILADAGLLGRRRRAPDALQRPAAATHADQRWHTDLMVLSFAQRWFWLVDVLDAYSRYLVHHELLLTAHAQGVHWAAQRAVETLQGRPRLPGEPEIVHDQGPQYVSQEWQAFVHATGLTDVPTRPHHPQSNGLDERFHRTVREEVPIEPDDVYYEVQERLGQYRVYYNEQRPHSALHYLRPSDYYRGDPVARLAEREAKLRQAAEQRQAYWQLRS